MLHYDFSGLDLLEAFGIKNGSAEGTREETGMRGDDVAYRVVGWRADLIVPLRFGYFTNSRKKYGNRVFNNLL